MAASLSSLLQSLRRAGIDIDAEGAMDAAWLAVRLAAQHREMSGESRTSHFQQPADGSRDNQAATAHSDEDPAESSGARGRSSTADPTRRSPGSRETPGSTDATIRLPVAPALPQSRLLARALRPLRKRVPSAATDLALDVERTVRRASEEGIWLPVFRPRAERWLDVAVVVDRSVSMLLWMDAVEELKRLLRWSGAFRSIATWWVQTDTARPLVFRRQRDVAEETAARVPGGLTPVARRGLVLVVTDCVSARWYDGSALEQLRRWSRGSMVALAQVLPQPFWSRTALGEATAVQLRTPGEGATNAQLRWTADFAWIPEDEGDETIGAARTFVAPVVPLEPAAVLQFARLVAGRGTDSVAGAFFDLESMRTAGVAPIRRDIDAKERVARFFSVSSSPARRLAAALAASPVLSLRLLRLLRQELIPDGRRSHEAEVLLSGFLVVRGEQKPVDAYDLSLEFLPGVRSLLLDSVTTGDAIRVLRHAAQQAADRLPEAQTFLAALEKPSEAEGALDAGSGDFMRLASEVLDRVGGAYGRVAVAAPDPAPGADVILDEVTTQDADVPASSDAPITPDAGHLSTPVTPFVNREAELAQLWEWWTNADDPRPMFLTGSGGVGKTALASAFVGRVLTQDPPDGGVLALLDADWEQLPHIYEYFFGPHPLTHPGTRQLIADMATSRTRRRRLLVLDGGPVTMDDGRSLLMELCSHFASTGQGRLLVIARSQRTAYGFPVIDLGPLDDAAVLDWLARAGVPTDTARSFLQHAQGRPSEIARWLEQIASSLRELDVHKELPLLMDPKVPLASRLSRLSELRKREDITPETRVRILTYLATTYAEADRREDVEAALAEARQLAGSIEDPQGRAQAWNDVGLAEERLGDTWGAMESFELALAEYERLGMDLETAKPSDTWDL